ncbi:hypothetical protein ABK040_004089 [Willaertia magna]
MSKRLNLEQREKYGSFLEEFNTQSFFPNNIRWCNDNGYIAVMTNNGIYLKNIESDKKGTILQSNALPTNSDNEENKKSTNEPNRTSIHFRDRLVIHPSMFVRFISPTFRSINWSKPFHENDCYIYCITSDNNCKIYKKPNISFQTNWDLIFDIKSLLQEYDKTLEEIELQNGTTVSASGLIICNDNNDTLITNDLLTTTPKKSNRTFVSKKTSTVMSFEQQFFARFYKLFTEESGYDPSKEEYKVDYRKWTKEEQKIYDKLLKQLLEEYKDKMEELNVTEEGLTKNLYTKLRTKMRKDREKGKVTDVLCNIYSPEKDKKKKEKSSNDVKNSGEDNLNVDNNENDNNNEKRKQNEVDLENSDNNSVKKQKRLYFSRGTTREKEEELSQTQFIHRLHITEVLSADFSDTFSIASSEKTIQAMYLACGTKTGFISIFGLLNDSKIVLLGYFKAFSTFVTHLKFLYTDSKDNFFILSCGSSSGELKFFKIPKASQLSIEKKEDLLDVKQIIPSNSSNLFSSDDISFATVETIHVTIETKTFIYLSYAKGVKIYLYKFLLGNEGELIVEWVKSFSCQDSTISGITMQYFSIESNETNQTSSALLLYSSSIDGSLVQWKIIDGSPNEAEDIKDFVCVYIITKRSDFPIWGCSLSSNSTHISMALERPATRETRADLENRSKIRLYTLPIYPQAIRSLYNIPLQITIPKQHFVDYFVTLLKNNNLNVNQLFDVITCLSSNEMEEITNDIITTLVNISEKENNSKMKTKLYFLYHNISSKLENTELKKALQDRKVGLQNELRYFYSSNIIDFCVSGNDYSPIRFQLLLICDWVLLFYQLLIKGLAPEQNELISFINRFKEPFIANLEKILRLLDNEEKHQAEIQFTKDLHSLFSNEELQKNNDFIIDLTNREYLIERDYCPICMEGMKMEIGERFPSTKCSKNHPIIRDTLTFETIKDIYIIKSCPGCGEKTNKVLVLKPDCPLCGCKFCD